MQAVMLVGLVPQRAMPSQPSSPYDEFFWLPGVRQQIFLEAQPWFVTGTVQHHAPDTGPPYGYR